MGLGQNVERLAAAGVSALPAAPPDTLLMLLEVGPEDIHFVDNIIKSHDHVAQVRRNYQLYRGRPCYEVLIPVGFLDEVEQIVERLKAFIWVGQVVVLEHGVPVDL